MGTAKSTKEKLDDIIDDARSVMLLSHGEDGKIVGRPMALQRSDADDTLYLVANVESKKVSEVEANPQVSIAVQDREGIAMISGVCRVSRDRTLIDELWKDSWAVWFRGGRNDPGIAILIFEPEEATYWDQDLGHGLSYLYRYVKARLAHTQIETRPGDQKKVDLRRH